MEIDLERTEQEMNASSKAILACSIKDSLKKDKFWYAFKINETPSSEKNNTRKYHYSMTIDKKLSESDELVVFVWNIEHQTFTINKFNLKIYDYNFET